MQRASYLLCVSAAGAEGAGFSRDGRLLESATRAVAPGETPLAGRMVEALEGLLDEHGWSNASATLVVPTAQASFRRLGFPFREAKKIRQALPFELESELLDPPEAYRSEFQVHVGDDGGAHVPVFLLREDEVAALVEACEQRGLAVQKLTFAAMALLSAEPAPTGLHFQIYLGADEAFVLMLEDGRVETVQTLALSVDALREALAAQHRRTPGEMLSALARVVEQGGMASAPQPEAEADDAAPARAAETPVVADAAAEALLGHLRAGMEDVNRFVRIHALEASFTVSLHGLYAPLFHWDGDAGTIHLRAEPLSGQRLPEPPFAGVLAELQGNVRPVLSARGVNFSRRVGAWRAHLREARWPLVAAVLLVLAWGVLMGTEFYFRTAELNQRLDAVNQRLRAALNIPVVENPAAVNTAVSRLENQVDALKRERAAEARFADYDYEALGLLEAIARVVAQTPRFTVDSLAYTRERFTMAGTTPNYTDSEAVKRRLLALPRFEGRTGTVTHSRSGQVIRYRLVIEPRS